MLSVAVLLGCNSLGKCWISDQKSLLNRRIWVWLLYTVSPKSKAPLNSYLISSWLPVLRSSLCLTSRVCQVKVKGCWLKEQLRFALKVFKVGLLLVRITFFWSIREGKKFCLLRSRLWLYVYGLSLEVYVWLRRQGRLTSSCSEGWFIKVKE
jgi:hypothetical protein